MSIDVLVKQNFFSNKAMPLDIILGENLHYGDFADDQLNVGTLGKEEFIAYNPKSIGRGFSVIWNQNEKKKIALRLPQPSTTQELTDFYAAVERMAKHWGASLVVDGSKMSLDTFMAGFQDMLEFNNKVIKQFSQEILNGEHENLTLYSAMYPLTIGKEEATRFLDNPDDYAQWLHEKQSIDVRFASPRFFMGDNGIFARYTLFNDLPTIFPNQPTVPFGITDPSTGKALECNDWGISIGILEETSYLCEMAYSEFLSLIPENKKSKFDATHFLLSELTKEEIKIFANKNK